MSCSGNYSHKLKFEAVATVFEVMRAVMINYSLINFYIKGADKAID